MDLTSYLKEGHFQRDVETLLEPHNKWKWELLYHASGKRDPNIITEFQQKMLVEWIPTIRGFKEAGVAGVGGVSVDIPSEPISNDGDFVDANPLNYRTLQHHKDKQS